MNIKASDANYNSFASEAFIFIGDVYLDLFAMRSLKNFVGRKQNRFFTKYLLLLGMFNV